jgi:hypothetical protein
MKRFRGKIEMRMMESPDDTLLFACLYIIKHGSQDDHCSTSMSMQSSVYMNDFLHLYHGLVASN